ncbi:MAG: hypothetical protein QOE69_1169 [Thermoleophilaceae bacterium]|jgi:hypothetical protein|nr:hypothetical protein [Thermoleophilaceae bacterium]
MDLKSPTTLGLAWILAPLLITLAAAGLGSGLARLAGLRLGPLTLPAGFLAGVALMNFAIELGVPGIPTVVVCALAALAGGVLWFRDEGLPEDWRARWRELLSPAAAPGGAALAAYAIGMAPLVGSGRSGVVGYILNNDPSVHVSAVELLRDHGAKAVDHNASSYEFVSTVFTGGYPLGSHVWPLFGTVVAGIDAFHVWSPVIAVMLAMLALVTYQLVRELGAGRIFAAVAGTAIACGYLPYSYLAQGGAKEVAITLAVYGTLALLLHGIRQGPTVRSLLPAAVSSAAAIGIFGLGALAWLAPLALGVALILLLRAPSGAARRARAKALVAAAGVAVLASVPAVLSSISFLKGSDNDLVNPAQVGNLVGPVPWVEAFNVWLAYDYRFPEADYWNATRAAVVVAALLALVGVIDGLRTRRFVAPLALLAGGVGAVVISARYAIYLDAKSFVVLAPAFGLATAAGVLALARRRRPIRLLGLGLGCLLAAGVLASDSLVYAGAWMTPKDRFEEMIDLSKRYEGQGPMLVNEREDYAKYFFRKSLAWESWGAWQPDRGFRYGRVPLPVPRTPDFDDYTLGFMSRFKLLVDRRGPTGSVPPANFELIDETPHYRVFRRVGPMPKTHFSLGTERYDGADRLDCANPEVKALLAAARNGDGQLVAAPGRPEPIAAPADRWQQFGGVFYPGPTEGFATRRGGVALPFVHIGPGNYDVWIQGGFGPGIRLMLGTRAVGDAFRDLGLHSGWQHLGMVLVEERDPAFAVVGLGKPFWQAGSRRLDVTGPLVFVPAGQTGAPERIPAGKARSLCGRKLDWVELN